MKLLLSTLILLLSVLVENPALPAAPPSPEDITACISSDKLSTNLNDSDPILLNTAKELGERYYDERKFGKAVKCLIVSAKLDDPKSQFTLGAFFYRGIGVPIDVERAKHWLLESAKNNDTNAMAILAHMYEKGSSADGVDLEKSFYWIKNGAELGNVQMQAILGMYYETGNGVLEDKAQARMWYQKAAANGHKGAKLLLKRMHE